MRKIDSLIRLGNDQFRPFWGWHDNHRSADGTPEYQPALQQVRSEFVELVKVADGAHATRRALQLGSGMCDASHHVWNVLFWHMVTIDWRNCLHNSDVHPGADTHSEAARTFADARGPYDFLFIDAGHLLLDVGADHGDYGAMVRPGGIIAFHDALPREGYPELGVCAYLDELRKHGVEVHTIGKEVGIAWIRK